jgi:hypothetical protein
MAAPAPVIPSKDELQTLIAEPTTVAANYSATPDLQGYVSRVQVIAKLKDITKSLITVDQLPNYHGLNVRSCFMNVRLLDLQKLIAIRWLSLLLSIKLKVFAAIPESGSISLADLSKPTGAQESLLGEYYHR